MSEPGGGLPLVRTSRFITFDGHVELDTRHQRPDRYRHLELDLGNAPRIPRGRGYSYAAASFGAGVVVQEMLAFDRLLDHDGRGLVRAEAGTTLSQLTSWAWTHGLHLPVLPGYPLITLGGAVAADVHGKNPARDGTFCDAVEALTLYTPARGFQTVTAMTDPELFAATCGGFGLTGLIVDVTLRLAQRPAPNVHIEAHRVKSLAEAEAWMGLAADHDFVYSWHDGSARGRDFGRGIVFVGRWSDELPVDSGASPAFVPMSAASRARWPVSLWTGPTVAAANAWFLRSAGRRPAKVVTAFDAAFPFARQTLYHRGFGHVGFAETQVLILEAAFAGFCERLQHLMEAVPALPLMLSLKRYAGRQCSLSMSGSGLLLTVDLARTSACAAFLEAFDQLVLDTGSQPNIAKDSRVSNSVASASLPHYQTFRERIRRFDPDHVWQSELSRRLDL